MTEPLPMPRPIAPACHLQEGGNAAERVERQIALMKCEGSFIRARAALNAAAQSDGNPTLSYDEYERAALDPHVAQQFDTMQGNMMHGLTRLTWAIGQRFIGRDVQRVNTVLEREGLPRIDAPFVRAAVAQRLR